MELVDVYNNKHESLNYTKGRKELGKDEYRLSCFAWIINSEDQLLIQQRVANTKNCPNMWETVSGGAVAGDTSLSGTIREIKEELGIDAKEEDMEFIGSYKRYNDFVEVFLLKSDIDLSTLILQPDEVQNAKWVSIDEYQKMIDDGIAVASGFEVFQNYYKEFYNKYMIIIDGKRVIKNHNEKINI